MTAPTTTKEQRSVRRGMTLILLATVGFGLNPLFARWAYLGGLTPESALVYRFLVPAAVLAPFLPAAFRAPAAAGRGLALGVLVGMGTLTYFRAIAVVPVATAALVYFTHPLFTILLGRLFFNVRLTARAALAAGLVAAACALILSPSAFTAAQLRTLAFSFLMPASFALLLLGFEHWMAVLPLWPRTAVTLSGQVAVILPVLLTSPLSAAVPISRPGWVGVLGLATVTSLLPQILMAAGIPRAGATRASVLAVAELLTSLAAGWLILSEPVYGREVAGAVLLLAAVLLATRT